MYVVDDPPKFLITIALGEEQKEKKVKIILLLFLDFPALIDFVFSDWSDLPPPLSVSCIAKVKQGNFPKKHYRTVETLCRLSVSA